MVIFPPFFSLREFIYTIRISALDALVGRRYIYKQRAEAGDYKQQQRLYRWDLSYTPQDRLLVFFFFFAAAKGYFSDALTYTRAMAESFARAQLCK